MGDWNRSHYEASSDGGAADLVRGSHGLHRDELHVRDFGSHHLFAVWNGDRRLQDKFGEKAAIIRERTSVIPFAAILSGRQKLPDNYIEEFL
eukprot:gene37924-45652_t